MSAEKNVDLIVLDAFFRNKPPGVFVEVGAAHPEFLSISARYRSNGWNIIAIEPNPYFCKLHRDRGYNVYEYACSDKDEDNVDFYIVDSKGVEYGGVNVSFESFSSLGIKDEFSDLYKTVEKERDQKKIKVMVRKLDSVLKDNDSNMEYIDILAIDVEGWELSVLSGFSIEKYAPKVVILENLFKKREYRDYMKRKNYYLWRHLEPNEVYISNALKSSLPFMERFLATIKSYII